MSYSVEARLAKDMSATEIMEELCRYRVEYEAELNRLMKEEEARNAPAKKQVPQGTAKMRRVRKEAKRIAARKSTIHLANGSYIGTRGGSE